MLIEKIINNNIVSAVDSKGREVVVMGRGLGFGMKPGKQIQENKIEKVFRIKSQTLAEQFKDLLADMPLEHVKVSSDIITYAKENGFRVEVQGGFYEANNMRLRRFKITKEDV